MKSLSLSAQAHPCGFYDFYVAAQNFREDNPLFTEALAAIKGYARMTDEQAEAILSKCIYEE